MVSDVIKTNVFWYQHNINHSPSLGHTLGEKAHARRVGMAVEWPLPRAFPPSRCPRTQHTHNPLSTSACSHAVPAHRGNMALGFLVASTSKLTKRDVFPAFKKSMVVVTHMHSLWTSHLQEMPTHLQECILKNAIIKLYMFSPQKKKW